MPRTMIWQRVTHRLRSPGEGFEVPDVAPCQVRPAKLVLNARTGRFAHAVS